MDEIEAERLHLVAKLRDDDWPRKTSPGSLYSHEALDRTHVFGDMLRDHLLSHPAILARPSLFALVKKAEDALGELYQAINNTP